MGDEEEHGEPGGGTTVDDEEAVVRGDSILSCHSFRGSDGISLLIVSWGEILGSL